MDELIKFLIALPSDLVFDSRIDISYIDFCCSVRVRFYDSESPLDGLFERSFPLNSKVNIRALEIVSELTERIK